MKNSEKISKEIKILIKERDYCDLNDFDKRGYLNERIEKLMSRKELELNKEMGIQYLKTTKEVMKMNAYTVVEIRKIEDQICLSAMKGDLKSVFEGYKKINDIRLSAVADKLIERDVLK